MENRLFVYRDGYVLMINLDTIPIIKFDYKAFVYELIVIDVMGTEKTLYKFSKAENSETFEQLERFRRF